MWKPGEAKPAVTPKQQSKSKSPSSASSSAKKKLSGSTMNMRFMKKRSDNTQASPLNSAKSPQQKSKNEEESSDMMDHEATSVQMDDNDDVDVVNADMYGSDIIGRRSFGGFKKMVDRNWQDSVQFSKGETSSRTSSQQQHVSDDELLKRYQELIGKRGQNKKRAGVSSNGGSSKKKAKP